MREGGAERMERYGEMGYGVDIGFLFVISGCVFGCCFERYLILFILF